MTDTDTTDAEPQADDHPGPAELVDTEDDPDTAGGEPSGENDTDSDHDASPNAEAARYRKRLREVEAERDQLAERLAGYQHRECEATIADLLDIPADLWEVGGADASAFYGDDGTLNTAELRAAAGALIEQRPRLAKPPALAPQWGQNGTRPPPSGGPSWSEVINPHTR